MDRKEIVNSQDYKATKIALDWWKSLPLEVRREQEKQPDIIDTYADGVIYGWNNPQWIPVEERLPEHCDCLLYTEPRNIHGPFEGRFRFGFYNYADQRWEIRGEKWDNTIVTHWMPIVPPRKEEEK